MSLISWGDSEVYSYTHSQNAVMRTFGRAYVITVSIACGCNLPVGVDYPESSRALHPCCFASCYLLSAFHCFHFCVVVGGLFAVGSFPREDPCWGPPPNTPVGQQVDLLAIRPAYTTRSTVCI